MSIGIIGTRGIPNQYGGYEAAVQELAPRLVEMGHEVVVYCSSLQKTKDSIWRGVELVYGYDPEDRLGSFGQFIYDLLSNIASKKHHHDVIFHMGYTSDSLWFRIWDKRAVHITNMDGMEWMRSKYSPRVQRFLKKAEKWAANNSRFMIADSIGIRDYLEENYTTPVKHITYGVTIPADFDESILKEYQLSSNKYDLIVARIVPENNIEVIISAKLKSNNDIPLLVYGNRNEMLENLQSKFSNEKRIRFMEANYNRGSMDSIRHFSRFYIHGHSVGGTNPSLLEAMAAESRVLAHDNVFNRGVLKEGGSYFSSTKDLADLFNSDFEQLISVNQIENNLIRLRTNYNWDKISKEYEEVSYIK